MTDVAMLPELRDVSAGGAPGVPPIKPPWLRSVTTAAVVAAHLLVAWMLVAVKIPLIGSPQELTVDLNTEDIEDQDESAAAEETPPPPEAVEEPELAMEAPQVLAPEALPMPEKKKDVVEKKPVERKVEATQRSEDRVRMRRSSSMSQSAFIGQLISAIKRHTPGSTSLGPGSAHVTFHVGPAGNIYNIAASGSPKHAALARRIVSSVHAPPPPSGHFFGALPFSFH